MPIDDELWRILACPSCRNPLRRDRDEARCSACGTAYPVLDGQPDLHLRDDLEVRLPVVVSPFGKADPQHLRAPAPIPRNPTGTVDADPYAYGGRLWYGNGLTRELVSWFPSGDADQVLVDLGCGTRRVEPVLRRTGMSYLSLDVAGREPDVLGVAEALPLLDDSADFVFALGVLAHTTNPFLACHEIARVLRPGAPFIGTTQFLEPCTMQSRHHSSYLGLCDWLLSAGFEILEIEANRGWSGPQAMFEMGYYPPRVPLTAKTVTLLVEGLHRAYRRVRPAPADAPVGEGLPEAFTGGFRFVARKPS